MKLSLQFTPVEYKHLKFVIFDAPSNANVESYIQELAKHNIKQVARCCDPTYDSKIMLEHGITVNELAFNDGDLPPKELIQKWLNLVRSTFPTGLKSTKCKSQTNVSDQQKVVEAIGVHCIAGLGRAPSLVAVALIEAGMTPLDAVIYVRERRKGAINAKQLKFLESYRKATVNDSCIIL